MSTNASLRLRRASTNAVMEAEWRALFHDTPLAIAYVSPELRVLRVNGPFAVLCGRMAGEVLGRLCYEVLGEGEPDAEEKREAGPCSFCPMAECLRTGMARELERPFGERVLKGVVAPMRNRWGAPLGAVLMLHDVTAERGLQGQLIEAHKLTAIGLMTSGVAHELRNPLTSISGFAQLLRRRTDLPEDVQAHVERICSETQRCERLVGNLLKFTRAKTEGKTVVNVSRVVREALDLQRYQLATSGVRFHEDYYPTELPVFADRCQLHQVVQNIVSNALDAIAESRQGSTLTVRTGLADGRVVVEFENDGPALPEPDKVFAPLYTTKPAGKGTGLGLSVSHTIIREHNGTILAMNTPQGVLFRVALPPAPAGGPADAAEACPRGGRAAG